MPDTVHHARVTDLPGWTCPPYVRDISNCRDTWGKVHIDLLGDIAQDQRGYLWADGEATPANFLPQDSWDNPGAVVCWTETGLGLWVHPKSRLRFRTITPWDVRSGQWVPVAVVLTELPSFVTGAGAHVSKYGSWAEASD